MGPDCHDFRFVPYIGALISAIFPLILAAAVGSGWEMLVLTAALFVVLELLAGQVLEPLIFGHSTGLSPVAIILVRVVLDLAAGDRLGWYWRRLLQSVLLSLGAMSTVSNSSTLCLATGLH